MSETCTSYEIFQRVWLVASNIVFILPVIYCILLTIRNKLAWYSLIPEMFFSFITMICSTLYHMCDNGTCGIVCVTEWKTLYNLDFIFSYQIIHIVFMYTTEAKFTLFKIIYLLAALVANIIFILSYKGTDFDNYFYLIIAISGLIITIGRLIYLWYTNKLTHMMKEHFDLRAGTLALICCIIGVLAKILTPNEFYYYWWGHSIWHIFIGLAILFAFNMYDIYPLLCCLKKKPCFECENQRDGTFV
jgi:hypothetical protein